MPPILRPHPCQPAAEFQRPTGPCEAQDSEAIAGALRPASSLQNFLFFQDPTCRPSAPPQRPPDFKTPTFRCLDGQLSPNNSCASGLGESLRPTRRNDGVPPCIPARP